MGPSHPLWYLHHEVPREMCSIPGYHLVIDKSSQFQCFLNSIGELPSGALQEIQKGLKDVLDL